MFNLMKRHLVFLLLSVLSFSLHAQSKLSGKVTDAIDNQKLTNATLMLITAKDSILVDFTYSDEAGSFSMAQPDTGTYLLIASYPKYGDFYTEIVPKTAYQNLSIGLTSTAQLLEEVVVTGRIPIKINGDTTEYDAGSFTVEKNAKVEDLLKVLPGITVDAAGNITAQGKTVKRVLVDGEEFFGDDPTLVTRNLRSDMVDKVQVYEKKSEQAERTGVDDGQREQTINVKLKEDAKNGLFGKALLGGGTDEFYMGQLMINKFKGSQKISAYSLFGNNATTSLGREDAEKFGGDSGVTYGDDGSTWFTNVQDPFSGQGVVGVPNAINTGVTYSDRFNEDKHKVNLNYKYGRISSDGREETIMSGIINNNMSKNVDTENDQHRVNLKYDLNLDSLNSLTIAGNATKKNLWTVNDLQSQQLDANMQPVITNNSREMTEADVSSFRINALYTHKFMKKGRSFTFNGQVSRDENDGGGTLFSRVENSFTNTDSITDQVKNRLQTSQNQRASLTYTEPLSKVLNLSLGGGIERNKNSSLVQSFNKSASGEYNELDERFSNDYEFDRLSSNYKVALNYTTDKFRANLSNSLNNDKLNQFNNNTQDELSRTFFTYNPSLNGSYSFTKSKVLWFNYNGRNQLPSLSQIQPILDNSDPLNQYIGNEALKPSFSNSFNAGYNSFKLLTGSYIYLGGNVVLQKDPISQNINIDRGVNFYEWNNIEGETNVNANAWAGHYFKIDKDLGLGNSPQLSFNWNKNYNFFNGDLNQVNTTNFNFTYNIIRDTKTGLNFNVSLSPQYRLMKSSLQTDINSNGFVFGSDGSVEYFFTKTLKVYANYNYTYEAPTQAFDQKFEQFLIHPGVSKKFLKNESLVVDFMINDVLNQNRGFSRSAVNSVFTQRRFDTIRRYYMLKVSWDFAKMFVN
ncbi:TonB-dependent receptor [Sphingobacterium deserti]|uniref:TonB-dependent receptor n=2 Tax=Sphingobacterium deserti TaxID=1229276 RepID=A0A0B8SZU5_9SPHI|nr:TonB-dependent receptor [Sphingobacterium deserti]